MFTIRINKLKKISNTPVIIGGQHFTIVKKEAFDDCFDFGIVGEAEYALPQFLEKLGNGKD